MLGVALVPGHVARNEKRLKVPAAGRPVQAAAPETVRGMDVKAGPDRAALCQRKLRACFFLEGPRIGGCPLLGFPLDPPKKGTLEK